jgi:hypothetical protein
VLAPVDVEVEAWALGDEGAGDVAAGGFVAALPAVDAEVVPVLVWAFDPLEPAWVPVEVVVPVWALELPPAACVPDAVVVPAWALDPPELTWLPVEVVVLVCAFDPLVEVVGADAVVVGADDVVVVEGVVDVLLVCNVEEPPVDLVAGDEGVAGFVHHFVEYAFVVLPVVSDPEAETGVVVGTGDVLAEVFDELWVLAVPPASVGWTLIAG